MPLSTLSDAPAEVRGRWYDRLGAGAATLCAVHCAVLPFAIAVLPLFGLEFLASHAFEWVFLGLSAALAVLSVTHSWRHHGRFYAWTPLLLGLAILGGERFFPGIHEHVVAHAIAMSTGGLLVAAAHWINLRRAHGGPACPHPHEHH